MKNNQCSDCKGWGFIEFDDHSYGCAICEGTGIEPSCNACHDKGYTLKPGYDGVWREVVCKECENSLILEQDKWYVKRNNCVVGPIKKINDTCYPYWIPTDNYRPYRKDGKAEISGWINSEHDLVTVCNKDYTDLFNAVSKDFCKFTASIVCGMIQIHLSKEIKKMHLIKVGLFQSELLNVFDTSFYLIKSKYPKSYNDALSCWYVHYDWECRKALKGIGGCIEMSFKELINNQKIDRNNQLV